MFANAMAVFRLLEKTNCRKCNEPTCLSFAAKVFLGSRPLRDCPFVSQEVLAQYPDKNAVPGPGSAEDPDLQKMIQRITQMDFEDAARRTGGTLVRDRLTLRIFGKPFSIDRTGRFFSDIHINPWITGPVLTYLLESQGVPLTGQWVPFRELEHARELNGLFVKRTEEPLHQIADTHPGLFEDLILVFSGREIAGLYDSDISLVLYPLPLVPVLICYWSKSEEGMASQLNLFFDSSTSRNGGCDMVFRLTAGIVRMFEKLALTHGFHAAAS